MYQLAGSNAPQLLVSEPHLRAAEPGQVEVLNAKMGKYFARYDGEVRAKAHFGAIELTAFAAVSSERGAQASVP